MDPTLRRNVIGVIAVLVIPALAVWDPPFLPGGDARRVNRMIREAPGLIDRLPGDGHSHEAHAWFKGLAKAGYSREARRMAWGVRRPDLKNQALAAVSAGLFEARQMDEAASVARSIPDPKVRDAALRTVSLGYAMTGGVFRPWLGARGVGGKSVGAAAEVRDASQRDMGYADAARTLRIMNDDASAEDATRRIADPKARAEAQASKAWTLALKGEPGPAVAAASEIPDPARRVAALANVAGVLAQRSAETGDPGDPLVIGGRVIDRRALGVGAVEAARRAVKDARRSGVDAGGAQAVLVDVLGKTRRFAEARKAAAEIDDPARRAEVIGGMVRSLAEGGEPAEALEVARGVTEPRARTEALTGLIEAAGRAAALGRPAPGAVVAEAADAILAASAQITTPSGRSEALHEASRVLTRAGFAADAVRAARGAVAAAGEVVEQGPRAYSLADAALAMADAGTGREAALVARRAIVAAAPLGGSPYHDDGPLQRAARALSRALPAGEAVEFATGLDDPHARALGLAALADVLGGYAWDAHVGPATRAADRALWAARGIVDPAERAADLAAVVEVAARAGSVGPALAAARSIPEAMAGRRSQALAAIAAVEADRTHYDRALEISAPCAPADRLRVFANILAVSSTEPTLRRFGRVKAARARGASWSANARSVPDR